MTYRAINVNNIFEFSDISSSIDKHENNYC